MFNWKEYIFSGNLLGLFWIIHKVTPVANNQMFFVKLMTMNSRLLQIGRLCERKWVHPHCQSSLQIHLSAKSVFVLFWVVDQEILPDGN